MTNITTTSGDSWDFRWHSGAGYVSIRQAATMLGVSRKSLYGGGSVRSKKLRELLAAQGLSGGCLWATDGISDAELAVVIRYYAHHAKRCTDEAKALLNVASAAGLRQLIKINLGIPEAKTDWAQLIADEPERKRKRFEAKDAEKEWQANGERCKVSSKQLAYRNAICNSEATGIAKGQHNSVADAIFIHRGLVRHGKETPRERAMTASELDFIRFQKGGTNAAVERHGIDSTQEFLEADRQSMTLAMQLKSGAFFKPATPRPALTHQTSASAPRQAVKADHQGRLELLS